MGETSSSSHGKFYCGSLSQLLLLTFLKESLYVCRVENTHMGAHRSQTASDPWSCELPACHGCWESISVLCER